MDYPKLPVISLYLIIISLTHITNAEPTPTRTSNRDFLVAHNAVRGAVHVPPLELSPEVTAYAQTYAQKRSQDCAVKPSDGRYGENLAVVSSTSSAKDVVDKWVKEKEIYVHGSYGCIQSGECANYTQITWIKTRRLGCAVTPCRTPPRRSFVVCSYDPPGNFLGERPY